jgi:Zn-dependent oligopeptidase
VEALERSGIGDSFARPSKRRGAWMGAYRTQERLAGDNRRASSM